MKTIIVNPRVVVQKGDYLGSGVPTMPLEPAILATELLSKGFEVDVLDLFGSAPHRFVESGDHYLQGSDLLQELRELEKPDIFLIFASCVMAHGEVQTITRTIKTSFPNIPVAILENSQSVIGYSLAAVAQDLFASGADALVCGNIHIAISETLEYLKAPNQVSPPPQVITKERKTIAKRPALRTYTSAIPSWHLFPLKNYWGLPYSHGPKRGRFLPILSSRGCRLACDFCVIPETNSRSYSIRDPSEVVNEMVVLRNVFRVNHFQVEDVNPELHSKHWKEIVCLLIERSLGIQLSFVSGVKIDSLSLDDIPPLAQAGCRFISFSPESGSPALVKSMGKWFDHKHALKIVEQCRRYGIHTQACFIIGHPNENNQDHEHSVSYLKELVWRGLGELGPFIVAPVPGSLISKRSQLLSSEDESLVSFSPRGRRDWGRASKRRRQLIWTFFLSKIVSHPLALFLQGVRACFRIPRTKMENLPWRFAYVRLGILRYQLSSVIFRAGLARQ